MNKSFSIFIVLLALLIPTHAYTETFTAHCRDYPPEMFTDGNECYGAIPSLVSDVLADLGHNIEWIKAPWIRSIKEGKQGTVDLLIRHSMTIERNTFLRPIAYGYYVRELSFYKSPIFKQDIKSYGDLEKVRIGAIRGNFYSPTFSTLDTKELTLVGRTEQLLAMLEKGRIDIAVTSASHNIDLFEERFTKSTFVDSFHNPLYISLSKNAPTIKFYDDIANMMLKYRQSGKINLYFEKFGLPVPEQIFE